MPLSSLVKPISFVQENTNCLALLNRFLRKRSHISIVEDEYGGVAGLITLEDLLETVLGAEIVDETDAVVDLQKLARKRKKKSKPEKTES
jgi:CBS domain containing-hemolysin-like protein